MCMSSAEISIDTDLNRTRHRLRFQPNQRVPRFLTMAFRPSSHGRTGTFFRKGELVDGMVRDAAVWIILVLPVQR